MKSRIVPVLLKLTVSDFLKRSTGLARVFPQTADLVAACADRSPDDLVVLSLEGNKLIVDIFGFNC